MCYAVKQLFAEGLADDLHAQLQAAFGEARRHRQRRTTREIKRRARLAGQH